MLTKIKMRVIMLNTMIKKEFIPEIGDVEIDEYIPTPCEIDKIKKFEQQAERDIKKNGAADVKVPVENLKMGLC